MTVAKVLRNKDEGGAAEGVVTIKPNATVADAARTMAERRIGALVVSPDGAEVVGILSERDVVREVARGGGAALGGPVEAVMTRRVETCSVGDTAQSVLERMTRGRFRHLPVVKDGQVHSMVTIGDVVKYRLDEALHERDALENMVMGHG